MKLDYCEHCGSFVPTYKDHNICLALFTEGFSLLFTAKRCIHCNSKTYKEKYVDFKDKTRYVKRIKERRWKSKNGK